MTIQQMIDRNPPTGPYQTEHWAEIVAEAKRPGPPERHPALRQLAENYERTGHPACLNAIMSNADIRLWGIYYTGK